MRILKEALEVQAGRQIMSLPMSINVGEILSIDDKLESMIRGMISFFGFLGVLVNLAVSGNIQTLPKFILPTLLRSSSPLLVQRISLAP